MLQHQDRLKILARTLRSDMTNSEQLIWKHLRRKQISNVTFYRQKIIGNYIVDFYSHRAKLVIEINGSQHLADENINKDKKRDYFLENFGLKVLRFNNLEILQELNSVLEVISNVVVERIGRNPP